MSLSITFFLATSFLFLCVFSNLCAYPSSVQGSQQEITLNFWVPNLNPLMTQSSEASEIGASISQVHLWRGKPPCGRGDLWDITYPKVYVTRLTLSPMFLANDSPPRVEFPICASSTRQSYLPFPLLQKEKQLARKLHNCLSSQIYLNYLRQIIVIPFWSFRHILFKCHINLSFTTSFHTMPLIHAFFTSPPHYYIYFPTPLSCFHLLFCLSHSL